MTMTLCRDCKHHLTRDQNSPRANIWYNHFCGASPNELVIDPVTGLEEYEHGEPYRHCRSINDGNCQLFEPGPRDVTPLLRLPAWLGGKP
jgi:hypothetical protein